MIALQDLEAGPPLPDHANSGDGGEARRQVCAGRFWALRQAAALWSDHRAGAWAADGKVGTRNYLGVLTTVNCLATVAKLVAEAASRDPWFQILENIDGIVQILHGTGCAVDLKGEGCQLLFRTLQGYAQHANFGGILLIGRGCEAMLVPALVGAGRLRTDNNFRL